MAYNIGQLDRNVGGHFQAVPQADAKPVGAAPNDDEDCADSERAALGVLHPGGEERALPTAQRGNGPSGA